MSSVRTYYDTQAENEWERLALDPFHQLEFRATMACLRQHLPGSGLILDAGGGPGRYARELCRMGYDVVLFDLSERCLAVARERFAEEEPAVASHLKGVELGEVLDLSRFTPNSFDAVLCLCPLSHIIGEEERKKALVELVRVAKAGAPIFLGVISYYAVLRTVLVGAAHELVDLKKQSFPETGDYHAPGAGFPDTHFFKPEELQREAEAVGLQTVEMRACEGLSANFGDATNALPEHEDGRWEEWLRIWEATRHDPAVIATSEHFLYVGKKP